MKFCSHCGQQIDMDCVVCPLCGKQVKDLKQDVQAAPNITINNSSNSSNVNSNRNSAKATAIAGGRGGRPYGRRVHKMTALLLCIFLGYFGAHKFYAGRKGMGILYLCTAGLCGIGWIVDCVLIGMKPGPYYYIDDGRGHRRYD